jgi:hypothetical protein
MRTTTRTPTPAGRRARPTPPRPPRRSRPAPTRRGVAGGWMQRRKPQPQSRVNKAVSALTGALPGRGSGSAAKPASRRGKAGGLAVLAGAAGLAFKNREKLTGLLKRRGSKTGEGDSATTGAGDMTGTTPPAGAPSPAGTTDVPAGPGTDAVPPPTGVDVPPRD